MDAAAYWIAHRHRAAHFSAPRGAPGGVLAREIVAALRHADVFTGVRIDEPTRLRQRGEDLDVVRDDLLLFSCAGAGQFGAYLGVAPRRVQAWFSRCTPAGKHLIGLDADIRAQYNALVRAGAREHLADLVVLAPYTREAVERALNSPLAAKVTQALGLSPRFVAARRAQHR